MNIFKRLVLWDALIAIIALAAMSAYGAFLGADRAKAFFNSLPLAIYWFVLIALLAAGIVLFRRLLRVPALLLMHLGCIGVLLGGIWGSNAGQTIQNKHFGADIIPRGNMPIVEGTSENRVRIDDSNDIGELPFAIRANDVRVEYYRIGTLYIQDAAEHVWSIRAEPGSTLDLGEKLGKITILKVFQNFKIDLSGDAPADYDAPGDDNPAVRIKREKPDGTTTEHRVFEYHAGHAKPQDGLYFTYRRMPSDYISELEVVQDGQVVAAKDIEVNHPLHYGGYHFYQSEYGVSQYGEYTILAVVPDTGLTIVYIGYAMLIAGVFWHFWGRRFLKTVNNRKTVTLETVPHGD